MGPIGAGKSTLCQAIAGLVPHAWGGTFGGHVLVEGLDTRHVEPADLCRRVGLVFQDPETQLFNVSVEDEVAFGPESLALPRDEIARRIDWALSVVHLADCRHRSPRQLSGGQKQRLAIAAALATRPAILVLDEPTASLDPRGSREVYQVIAELRRSGDLTVVLVEQDAERVAEFADRVAVLAEGKIAALGSPAEVFAAPGLPERPGVAPPPVCELAARLRTDEPDLPPIVTLADAERALAARLEDRGSSPTLPARADGAGRPPACGGTTGGAALSPDPPALEVRDLWYRYESGVEALRGVSLAVQAGERLAIVGQNGSGKTTLAKHFNGLLRPTRGAVLVEGEDAGRRSIGELASRVGYVFQNPDHQIFAATVWDELAFGPRQLGTPEAEVRKRVEEALAFFRLGPYRGEPPAALGFGLRRAVGLAAVLTMRPHVLVLDEPFTGLDWRATAAALDWLHELSRRGHTVVLVTHDMRAVAEFAERVLVLAEGRVAALDSTRSLFQRPDVLASTSLARPQIAELAARLRPHGLVGDGLTVCELAADYRRARGGTPRDDVPCHT